MEVQKPFEEEKEWETPVIQVISFRKTEGGSPPNVEEDDDYGTMSPL